MNRLRMLLITTALITGSAALASAQEYRYDGGRYEFRDHDRDRDRDGREDHDRRYFRRDARHREFYGDRDRRYFDRDDRWRDRDYRWR